MEALNNSELAVKVHEVLNIPVVVVSNLEHFEQWKDNIDNSSSVLVNLRGKEILRTSPCQSMTKTAGVCLPLRSKVKRGKQKKRKRNSKTFNFFSVGESESDDSELGQIERKAVNEEIRLFFFF
jgi:hypothetical protein